MGLREASTDELIRELSMRVGVKSTNKSEQQYCRVIVSGEENGIDKYIREDGPMTVIVVKNTV